MLRITPAITSQFKRTVDFADGVRRWRELMGLGAPQRYPRKSRLFNQGEAVTDGFLLAEGLVKLMYESENGNARDLYMRVSDDFVDPTRPPLNAVHPLSAHSLH